MFFIYSYIGDEIPESPGFKTLTPLSPAWWWEIKPGESVTLLCLVPLTCSSNSHLLFYQCSDWAWALAQYPASGLNLHFWICSISLSSSDTKPVIRSNNGKEIPWLIWLWWLNGSVLSSLPLAQTKTELYISSSVLNDFEWQFLEGIWVKSCYKLRWFSHFYPYNFHSLWNITYSYSHKYKLFWCMINDFQS